MKEARREGEERVERGAISPARYLHVTRAALSRFDLPPARFGLHGQVMHLDHAAAAEWAARVAGVTAGTAEQPQPAPTFSAGELLAAVALHELMHAVVDVETRSAVNPGAAPAQQDPVGTGSGPLARTVAATQSLDELATAFAAAYAPASPATAAAGALSARSAPRTLDDHEALVEELLLLRLALENPALTPLQPLFLAPELAALPTYQAALGALAAQLAPPQPGGALLELLAAPQRRAPESLTRQLELALALWGPRLSGRYEAALTTAAGALDVLAEESKPAWGPPGPPAKMPTVLVDDSEPEAYSPDAPWMPGVVLVAKSTHVWLAQLSARFGKRVTTLDDVPDEALEELAQQGFNALWLIGVWWRSDASRKVKQLRGQPDAMASAYSVKGYVVAPELGGEKALARLSERAARYGVRLASDMVPNHTAIDSEWLLEHPDRFVQVAEPPFPGYTFTGPDLADDPRAAVRIEDGYYDGTDAAVVFQRVDRATGEARYVYHGNDGTALPWNDTAQLDFLQADVRRAVIATTVAVARRFPLIRLDAAMTLARRHFRRLWHPQPGEGGAIPSRAARALSRAEFDERMPREFWRELVDALALEAPGTMLLAEAFWLMEVYFVRSLGMNRVYNSAFMHMTKNEQNAEYRDYLKRFLQQAPPVLARFVNYMSNPDEESAAEQYGDGDKAFGVATLMATLPGLPMFGHGQVEGLREKYGMEFARPRTDEQPRPWHVERHLRQVTPLLARRALFAGSEHFRLFDVVRDDNGVAEDVYAFVNGHSNVLGTEHGNERALVLYNNSPQPQRGRIHRSAPALLQDGSLESQLLHEALGVPERFGVDAVLRPLEGPEVRLGTQALARDGLWVELGAYEARVYLEVRTEATGEATVPAPAPARRARPELSLAVLTGRRGVAARRRSARRRR